MNEKNSLRPTSARGLAGHRTPHPGRTNGAHAAAAALALAGLATAAAPASAADLPLWELGLGAAGLHVPHYRGSDQSRNFLLPVPYVIYRGKIFKADREGARAVLLRTDRFDFDLSLNASPPASSRNDRARSGMDDLKTSVEIGPNVNYTLAEGTRWQLRLRLPLRAAFTIESHPKAIGWTSTPNIDFDFLPGGDWKVGLKGGPVFGSRRFHGYYYDVAPSEATSTRPAYDAPAGFGGSQLTASASHRAGRLWTGLYLRYDSVSGARFEPSPLVRQHDNLSFGIALAWVFATSSSSARGEE